MKIDCISDLHGFRPTLEGGDLLIIAGDLTAKNLLNEYFIFEGWLIHLKTLYREIIVIAGNHDGLIQKTIFHKSFWVCKYLEDSGYIFEDVKIWGSPWTPCFGDWHFMKNRGEEIKAMWDLIPEDTEILITHGPPYGILDEAFRYDDTGYEHAGCIELRKTILERLKKLKLHVFGHIHEGYGQKVINGVNYVNASIMNDLYVPENKPIRVIL